MYDKSQLIRWLWMVWGTALVALLGLVAIPGWPMVQQLFGGETSADRFVPFLWCLSAMMMGTLLYLTGSVLAEHTLAHALEKKRAENREREGLDEHDDR